MTKIRFVTIASFENSVAAHAAIALLERHNIKAWMLNATVADTMWQLNIATGGVKVQVEEPDAERAFLILEEGGSRDSIARGTWFCGTCQVTVEGQFEVCWSCGGLREEVEDKTATVVAESSDSFNFRDSFEGAQDAPPLEPSKNPYNSPRPVAAENDDEDEQEEDAEEELVHVRMKNEVRRGYYGSIIGLAICPFFMHIISLVILLSARFSHAEAEPGTRRQFYIGLIIDLSVIAMFIYFTFHIATLG